jgi:hypothetical protein
MEISMKRAYCSAVLVAALLGGPALARASSRKCSGEMTSTVWLANEAPTFTASCESCPSPNDAGYTCMEQAPTTGPNARYGGGFRLVVAGQSFSGEHFEGAGGTLYRYRGPLFPGEKHVIEYPGGPDHSNPMRYSVSFAVVAVLDAGPPDAAGSAPDAEVTPADAGTSSPDAGTSSPDAAGPPANGGASGCALAGARGSGAGGILLLVLSTLLARVARSRRRSLRQ